MSINITDFLGEQFKNFKLSPEQLSGVLSQANKMGIDLNQLPLDQIQPVLSSLLGQSGISSDIVAKMVSNISQDGFQMSDLTNLLPNLGDISKEASNKIAEINTSTRDPNTAQGIVQEVGEIIGGLFK
jgi:hypothetical protein